MFDLILQWFPPVMVLWISGSYLYTVAVKGRTDSALALATHALATTGWLVFGAVLTRFAEIPAALWYLPSALVLAGIIVLVARWPALRDLSAPVTGRTWLTFALTVVGTSAVLAVRLT